MEQRVEIAPPSSLPSNQTLKQIQNSQHLIILRAKDAVGIEIDTHAIQNAKHNSELNSFKIPFYNDNAKILNHSFDIVCANILSNVLIDLSTELRSFTRKKLILSGILLDQIDKVIKVFSDWIELKHFSEKEGWVLLYGELES